eukprot:scaffold14778_cov101-Cylindrotheca_fusiformis.AAC.1
MDWACINDAQMGRLKYSVVDSQTQQSIQQALTLGEQSRFKNLREYVLFEATRGNDIYNNVCNVATKAEYDSFVTTVIIPSISSIAGGPQQQTTTTVNSSNSSGGYTGNKKKEEDFFNKKRDPKNFTVLKRKTSSGMSGIED